MTNAEWLMPFKIIINIYSGESFHLSGLLMFINYVVGIVLLVNELTVSYKL